LDPRRLDPDIPDPVENRRSSSGRTVRFVYLAGLLLFAAFLTWHFLRFTIFLEGSGTISARQYQVSLPYTVHIESVQVVAGSRVRRGEVVAVIDSFEVEEYVSSLLRSIADMTTREAEFQIRLSIARASILPSTHRLKIAEETTKRFLDYARGSESSQYRTDIFRELSDAMEFHTHATVEANEVTRQLLRLAESRLKIETRLAEMELKFNGGKILSPMDGIVAQGIAKDGQTILPGHPIGSFFIHGLFMSTGRCRLPALLNQKWVTRFLYRAGMPLWKGQFRISSLFQRHLEQIVGTFFLQLRWGRQLA